MNAKSVNFQTFDPSPFEGLNREYVPPALMNIERQVRKYLYDVLAFGQNLSGPASSIRVLSPSVCLKIVAQPCDLSASVDILAGSFIYTSSKANEGLNLKEDSTMSIDVHLYPEALEPAFVRDLVEIRREINQVLINSGMIFQFFHPNAVMPLRQPQIPPTAIFRRIHPQDRIFLDTEEEKEAYEDVFGPMAVH